MFPTIILFEPFAKHLSIEKPLPAFAAWLIGSGQLASSRKSGPVAGREAIFLGNLTGRKKVHC
jgi:hypothetical protein